ncbi:hypothetical protein [Parabacteroides distasonis]
MANENSILKDISIVGQEALSSLLWEGHFVFAVNLAMFSFL